MVRRHPAELTSRLPKGHALDALQMMLRVISVDKQDRFAELVWESWVLAYVKQGVFRTTPPVYRVDVCSHAQPSLPAPRACQPRLRSAVLRRWSLRLRWALRTRWR